MKFVRATFPTAMNFNRMIPSGLPTLLSGVQYRNDCLGSKPTTSATPYAYLMPFYREHSA